MGMLIDGKWTHHESTTIKGAYERSISVHNTDISGEVITAIAKQPGRFVLIGSWTCPWSHRTLLIRKIKNLQTYIPLHMTGGNRIEGYPANYGAPWLVPGTGTEIIHLHQLYSLDTPTYTGRSTVPVLWDSQTQTVISNESAKIARAFDKVQVDSKQDTASTHFTLVPDALAADIEQLNADIYQQLSNGVYRANFAETQVAYDEAVEQVFNMMEQLDKRLESSRFLFGETLTESDWRLFPTLVRFDLEYFIHSRCSCKRLTEFSNLWAYARELYSSFNINETVNFDEIHKSNYEANEILPVPLHSDWSQDHHREVLGQIKVALTNGEKVIFSR